MAEKTPGKTRKNTSPKKSSPQQSSTVTPIDQASQGVWPENTAARKTEVSRPEAAKPSDAGATMEEQIRRRAYELFEERGREPGFEAEDWRRAEAEVRTQFQRGKSA
jgi:hypothetical protein